MILRLYKGVIVCKMKIEGSFVGGDFDGLGGLLWSQTIFYNNVEFLRLKLIIFADQGFWWSMTLFDYRCTFTITRNFSRSRFFRELFFTINPLFRLQIKIFRFRRELFIEKPLTKITFKNQPLTTTPTPISIPLCN